MYFYSKYISVLILVISVLFMFVTGRDGIFSTMLDYGRTVDYTVIGTPLDSYFESNSRASIPWNMQIFEDKLYIGCGDYDANSGPVPVLCYDLRDRVWCDEGELPDEQLNRFCIIDGKMVIPGTDPKEDWDMGNYYVWESDKWVMVRNIPGGIHNFDMTEFDGMVFAGLGVTETEYSIARSNDGGKSFSQVALYKNGSPIDTSDKSYIRTYDFLTLDGELYATYYCVNNDGTSTYELYKYEGGEDGIFVYKCDLSKKLPYKKISYDLIREDIEYDGKLFIATGSLYMTTDMDRFEVVKLPNCRRNIICDMYTDSGRLYVLSCYSKQDGQYKTIVWEYKDGGFTELFDFDYSIPCISFACKDSDFYIGMGNASSQNEKNGAIIHVCSE